MVLARILEHDTPAALATVTQRFVRGPSLWSGQRCLHSVLEMGPLARALTTEVPGLDQALLSLFPGMQDFAEPMRRGCFVAEALGRLALELQRLADAAPAVPSAASVHGKRSQVTIAVSYRIEAVAGPAFALAAAVIAALCGAPAIDIAARLATLRQIVQHARVGTVPVAALRNAASAPQSPPIPMPRVEKCQDARMSS